MNEIHGAKRHQVLEIHYLFIKFWLLLDGTFSLKFF